MISSILLLLALPFYAVSQLQQQGKLRWSESDDGFWGHKSYRRKYSSDKYGLDVAPKNWYYKIIRSPWKERWPTSTWLTVWATDGYHFCQFISLKFLYASVAVQYHSWWLFFGLWTAGSLVLSACWKFLSK